MSDRAAPRTSERRAPRAPTWVPAAIVLLPALLIGRALLLAEPPAGEPSDRTGSTAPAPTVAVAREGCVTASCHPAIKARPFLHGPVQANGCDGCHRLVDPLAHRFEPLSPPQGMCGLCHTTEHASGPVVHEPFASGDCLGCHDPHGSTEPAILRGERYADACLTCHKDLTGGHDRVHGPASVGACGACHEPHTSALPKLLNAEGRDLCLTCHVRTAAEIEGRAVVHAPVLGECRVCHDPHATDHPAILVEEPSRLCLGCHDDVAQTMHSASTQHAALTTKRACLNCHSPHAADHTALLREPVQQLCFECHNQPITLGDGTTLANMKAVIETGTSLHGAVTQRGCVECHEIHGGGHQRLLTNEYPSDLYYPFAESAYALCFGCHDRQLALLPETDSATAFRNGTTNLHYVHVNKDAKGRSCKLCHDTHAATRDKHIRDDVPYGNAGWRLPIAFQPLPDGGTCASGCHAAYRYNRLEAVPKPKSPDGGKPGAWKDAAAPRGGTSAPSPQAPSTTPTSPSTPSRPAPR